MRIAFIHPRFPSAEGTGATHSATQIVKGLTAQGHTVCVYCAQTPDENAQNSRIELRELTGNSNHPHTNTRLNKEIRSRIEEFREYDIVHSYLTPLMPSLAKIGESPNVETVVTLNAYGGTCAKNDLLYRNREQCQGKSISKCLECIASTGWEDNENGYLYETTSQLFSLRLIRSGESDLENISAFRAPSEHVQKNYVQFGYDPEKISVIPHPVDDDFRIPHQSDFAEPYKLLYVGSLAKHKGVEKLVPILSSLSQEDIEFKLTVVGTGGLEDRLREQARDNGVENLIEFTGFISNNKLPEVYANHDCFVYPGIWEEPLGRVYLEALATGTPIVTSEYGSIKSIIGDGGITTDGSIDDFHKKILNLVQEGWFKDLSQGAKKKASDYRLRNVISDINDIYGNMESADDA